MDECKPLGTTRRLLQEEGAVRPAEGTALARSSVHQGLTLVDVRAQLEQLQDTFMVGLYGGQKSSS